MKLNLITTKELRAKKSADIEKYITKLEQTQTEHNHALYTNKDKQTHQIKLIKKAIARAHTIKSSADLGKEK